MERALNLDAGALRLSREMLELSGEAAPPDNPVESAITHIFSDVLNIDGVGAEDSFFDLGGDSVSGVDLMATIEKALHVVLPVSTLVEAPTPRALARLVAGENRYTGNTSLVSVRPAGEGPPLICIHGLPGDVVFVQSLALRLPIPNPVYGMRAAGFQPDETPSGRMPEIVGNYTDEIATAFPDGPLWIMGYCGGSWIALEVARRLREAGREVLGLVMVDPAPLKMLRKSGLEYPLRWLRVKARTSVLRLASRAVRDGTRRRRLVRSATNDALDLYRPAPYAGKVLFIQSSMFRRRKDYPSFDTPSLAGSSVAFVEIDSTHHDLLVRNVEQVAAAIRPFIEANR